MIKRALTAEGLHDDLFQYFQKRFPKDISILDCGAGEGAWASRLMKGGYAHVQAVEVNPGTYYAQGPVCTADLNQDFSMIVPGRFDVITAIEVIEHLENPAHFLNECSKLLKPEGTLLITTPNTECAPGRLKFFLQGRLRHFDAKGDPTHITPILSGLVPKLAQKSGLQVAELHPLLRYWEDSRLSVRLVSHLLAWVLPGHVYGECHLFVLKPAPPA